MLDRFRFTLLLLFNNRQKHSAIFMLSILLIAILASVLFLATSLQKELQSTLKNQADFTVQKYRAGHLEDMPQSWIREFQKIEGVSEVEGRIYGTHYYEPKEQHFFIVGVDFHDTKAIETIKKLLPNFDTKAFLAKNSMLIGAGVKAFFDEFHYFKFYTFRPPDRSKLRVYIYDTLPKESNLISSDMILVDKKIARHILGIKKSFVSDAVIRIKDKTLTEQVYESLIMSHFESRIIKKSDIQKHYRELFNYKGGFFVTLYIVALVSFLSLLYQRYMLVSSVDVKEIAILRSLGWKIDSIISLKVIENAIVAITAYIIAVIIAYLYVFALDAPILQSIFLGSDNLLTKVSFVPYISLSDLAMLFALFVIPFLLSIIIPIWYISTKDISETLR